MTSGGYGYTVERSIAYAYLPAEHDVGTAVASRSSASGWRRGRGRAALRSVRRADPGVIDCEPVARVWPGAGSRIEVLGGGITNHNFKVERRRRAVCPPGRGAGHGLLGIDRARGARGDRAAAAVGIGPEVVAFVEPEGWLVTRFVEGEIPPLERMREPETIERVAQRFGVPRRPTDPRPLRRVPRRRGRTGRPRSRGGAIPGDYEWAHEVADADRGDARGRPRCRATTTS